MVTIKVCEYPRLPLPHRLKAVDFAKSIRDFMKKMLLQEKEILKINSISTLWNDISKRIFEKIEKLKDQDKADELLIELHVLDKKKYTVLMDSVETMNIGWKKLADELKVNIEKEMAQISIIQNEWKEEKSRIENIMDSKVISDKSTLKRGYYEIENEEDNGPKRIHTFDQCVKKLLQMQKQLLELQDRLLKQEQQLHQHQLQRNEPSTHSEDGLQQLIQDHLLHLQHQWLAHLEFDNEKYNYIAAIKQLLAELKIFTSDLRRVYEYKSNSKKSHSSSKPSEIDVSYLANSISKVKTHLEVDDNKDNSSISCQFLNILPEIIELDEKFGNKQSKRRHTLFSIQRYVKSNTITENSLFEKLKWLQEQLSKIQRKEISIKNIDYYYDDLCSGISLLQTLLRIKLYDIDGSSYYPQLLLQLQQLIPQNQKQDQNQSKSSFPLIEIKQVTSIQRGLSRLVAETIQLGIEDSSMYPKLDYLIELLSKYVNGYYSIYKELQEQLDKLPELLEELKQKQSMLENENNLKTVTTVNLEKVTTRGDLPKAEDTCNLKPSNELSLVSSQLGTDNKSSENASLEQPTVYTSAESQQEPDPSGSKSQADNQSMCCG